MKITLTITEDRPKPSIYSIETPKTETVTVVDLPDVEMTARLAGSLLRAVADEINPKLASAGGVAVMNHGQTLR